MPDLDADGVGGAYFDRIAGEVPNKYIDNGDGTWSLVAAAATPATVLAMDYDGGSNPVYIGRATPGSAKSAAAWQIRKLTYDGSGNLTDQQYAGGTRAYDQVWDSRAVLIYS